MNTDEFECKRLKIENDKLEADLRNYDNFEFDLFDWILHRVTGEFSNNDIDRDFCLTTAKQKDMRGRAIKKLISEERIFPANKKHGYYKLKDTELKKMDFSDTKVESVPIWLPFGIHKVVDIFKGNIIQINGEKNSGKSAMVLNIIKENMPMFNVEYFNSEMPEVELKARLMLFEHFTFSNWEQMNAYERASDFHHVLKKEKDTINIIDFLEQHDDFWLMGKHMRDIHDNLGESVGIVCVQLNKGAEQGLGGSRTEEKPRLILNVSPGKLKIMMAKNWATSTNPNGLFINFKLVNGCKFIAQGVWQEET